MPINHSFDRPATAANIAEHKYQGNSKLFVRPALAHSREFDVISSTFAGTYGGTARYAYVTGNHGVLDLSILSGNYDCLPSSQGESSANLGVITQTAVIEYPVNTFYQITWNGSSTLTLSPGGLTASDPTFVLIPPNTAFWVRLFYTIPTGTAICASQHVNYSNTNVDNVTTPAGGNFLTTSGTSWGSAMGQTAYGDTKYAPLAVFATLAGNNNVPVVAILGDSIVSGFYDIPIFHSFVERALLAANIGYHKIACAGERTSLWSSEGPATSLRSKRLLASTHVICNYGINDTGNGVPFATVKANYLILWNYLSSMGLPVYQLTLTPYVNLVNGSGGVTHPISTAQTQPNPSYEVVRQQVNAWLRGLSGSGSAMADAGGNLTGVIDSAVLVEADINNDLGTAGGWWYTGPLANADYTYDGIHPNALGHATLASAINTNLFTGTGGYV